MFWGVTINMKVIFGSVSENCYGSLSDLARFSLISYRLGLLGRIYPVISCRRCLRAIQRLLSANNVCNLAVFLDRPRYRTLVIFRVHSNPITYIFVNSQLNGATRLRIN